ncbi:MAG TPA: PsbP-related protein [Thermoanaerobaculia bacterium]|jgi:hypothetical protein
MKSTKILGGCGCLSTLIGLGLIAASFMIHSGDGPSNPLERFLPKPKTETAHYANTREGRGGNLAENYVDFSFDYPKDWDIKTEDPDNVNYVTVEKKVEGKTHENFNVGYMKTTGSAEGDKEVFPQLMNQLQGQFAQQFHNLQKVSEGPTKVGEYDAYEAVYSSDAELGGQTVNIFTRAILLPTPDHTHGVTLILLGTSFDPDLQSASDIGNKGELADVLQSFKFGE